MNELWMNSLQKKMRQLILMDRKVAIKTVNNLFSYVFIG